MADRRAAWARLRPQFHALQRAAESQRETPATHDRPLRNQPGTALGANGGLSERQGILDDTLEMIEMTAADPAAVLAALSMAVVEEMQAALQGEVVRVSESLTLRDAEVRARLRDAALAALDFYSHEDKPMRTPLVAACQSVLSALDESPDLGSLAGKRTLVPLDDPEAALRPTLRKSGAKPRPWIHKSRVALRDAGIGDHDVQTELLVAVGLLPLSGRPRLA